MNPAVQNVVTQLGLVPLPREGGFFRSTWTSPELLGNGRAAGSAIYFLLAPGEFSALHLLKTTEIWHFYAGDVVEHLQLDPASGSARVTLLGSDFRAGQRPQLVVAGGIWQGARIEPKAAQQGWSLVGTTMSPAWDENEFELGDRTCLAKDFPAVASFIEALTR